MEFEFPTIYEYVNEFLEFERKATSRLDGEALEAELRRKLYELLAEVGNLAGLKARWELGAYETEDGTWLLTVWKSCSF
jgi:hypothetical protein